MVSCVNLAIAIIGAVATFAAAIAATGSWIAARRANETASAVAVIERDRRHDELIPVFKFTGTLGDKWSRDAELRVELVGGRLERHAAVTVTILDEPEQDHWARGLPPGVTQEEAEAAVWGPWEFDTEASDLVVSNRESKPRPYSRISGKNWAVLPLIATRPKRWMMDRDQFAGDLLRRWDETWRGQPVWLLVVCVCDGYEPWFIKQDVKVEPKASDADPHA
jgi:hypothetical protein